MHLVLSVQDEKLKRLVECGGGEDWKQIAGYFADRSDVQCQHRWQKVLNPELIKGPWTKEVNHLLLCPIIPTAPDYLCVSTYNRRPLTL